LNAVQIQGKYIKVLHGMPIETKIEIPYTAFEVSPQAFSEAQTQQPEQSFAYGKQEQLLEFQKSH
jgi:hypothetical protein